MRAVFLALLWVVLPLQPAQAGDHLGQHGAGHDKLHHWYKTLRHPGTGYECCDGKDCRPTTARTRDGVLEVLVDGEWTRVPPDALVKATPPDLQAHVCAPKGSWRPKVIFCVVLGQGV
jgi:hypothetical protein